MEFFRDIGRRHEELKKRIHNFRIPLSPRQIQVAKVVYFSVPVVAGYFIMEWAQEQSRLNLGEHGEKLVKARVNERQPNGGADRDAGAAAGPIPGGGR